MYRKLVISSVLTCVFAAPSSISPLMSYSKLPTSMSLSDSEDDSYSTYSEGDYDTDFSSDSDFEPAYPRLLRTSERTDAPYTTEDFHIERVDTPPSIAPNVVRVLPPRPSVVSFAVTIDAEVERKPIYHLEKSTAFKDLTTISETTTLPAMPALKSEPPAAVHNPRKPKKAVFKKHINYHLPDYKFNQLDKRTSQPNV